MQKRPTRKNGAVYPSPDVFRGGWGGAARWEGLPPYENPSTSTRAKCRRERGCLVLGMAPFDNMTFGMGFRCRATAGPPVRSVHDRSASETNVLGRGDTRGGNGGRNTHFQDRHLVLDPSPSIYPHLPAIFPNPPPGLQSPFQPVPPQAFSLFPCTRSEFRTLYRHEKGRAPPHQVPS